MNKCKCSGEGCGVKLHLSLVGKVVLLVNAKEYLLELSEMREDIQSKKELRQEYLDMASSTSSPMNEVRVQMSRTDNGKVERYGTLAADLSREIAQDEQNYYEHKSRVVRQIYALHNVDYIKILFKVYVQNKSIRQASGEIGKTYKYIIQKHGDALIEFGRVYKDAIKEWENRKR